MGDFDPVSWDVIETATGSPAAEEIEYITRMQEDLRDEDPYVAVKTVHDAMKNDLGEDRALPEQGSIFIIRYLLEQNGFITSDDDTAEQEFASLTDRRPSSERLHELFWERERTMWWIATQVGVHWALVQYWLYEDETPLRERNFSEASMEQIRAYREDHT